MESDYIIYVLDQTLSNSYSSEHVCEHTLEEH